MRDEMNTINVVLLTACGQTVRYRHVGQFLDRMVARRVVDVGRQVTRLIEFPLHLVHRRRRAH